MCCTASPFIKTERSEHATSFSMHKSSNNILNLMYAGKISLSGPMYHMSSSSCLSSSWLTVATVSACFLASSLPVAMISACFLASSLPVAAVTFTSDVSFNSFIFSKSVSEKSENRTIVLFFLRVTGNFLNASVTSTPWRTWPATEPRASSDLRANFRVPESFIGSEAFSSSLLWSLKDKSGMLAVVWCEELFVAGGIHA